MRRITGRSTRLTMKPTTRRTTRPTMRRITRRTTRRTTRPTMKPTTRRTTRPTMRRITRRTTRLTMKPITRRTTRPTMKPITRRTTRPTMKPTTRRTTKPTMRRITRLIIRQQRIMKLIMCPIQPRNMCRTPPQRRVSLILSSTCQFLFRWLGSGELQGSRCYQNSRELGFSVPELPLKFQQQFVLIVNRLRAISNHGNRLCAHHRNGLCTISHH
jgi:hypothetical protein